MTDSTTETTPTEEYEEAPVDRRDDTSELIRPTGISWTTVIIGFACLGLAAVVLTLQWSDLRIDWGVASPAFVVGAGVLLLLAGAVGAVRGRGDHHRDEDIALD